MSNETPSILRPAPSRWDHWRDYANVLQHGIVAAPYRIDGKLVLARSGPFVPTVSFPSSANIVLTEQAKGALTRLVSRLEFRLVVIVKAVHLDWHEWDSAADEPARYPVSGEPEDYLSELPHDPVLAQRMGPLWELVPAIEPRIQGRNGCFRAELWKESHLMRADVDAGFNFVSPQLREALSAIAADCVAFVPGRPCE